MSLEVAVLPRYYGGRFSVFRVSLKRRPVDAGSEAAVMQNGGRKSAIMILVLRQLGSGPVPGGPLASNDDVSEVVQ